MRQNEAAAELAAQWWTDRLERGDKETFKASIQASILTALDEHGFIEVECDYDPDGPLLDAVRAAGIECSGYMFSAKGILPCKHSLSVTPTAMEPREGYGNWLPPIPI